MSPNIDKRIRKTLAMMGEYPIARSRTEHEWSRYRGVGPKVIAGLRSLGLVSGITTTGLSGKALSVLRQARIEPTKENIKTAFENSSIWRIENCGIVTIRELFEWAYVDKPNPPSEDITIP